MRQENIPWMDRHCQASYIWPLRWANSSRIIFLLLTSENINTMILIFQQYDTLIIYLKTE